VAPSRLTPHDIAAITAAFEQGRTRTELASHYGVHPNTITRLLRHSGTSHRNARKRALDPDQEQRLVEAYLAGESVSSIATRFDVTPQHVSRVAIHHGAARRRPGLPGRKPRFDDHAARILATEYQDGATLHMLAADHAATYSAVYRALQRSHAPRRAAHTSQRPAG